MRGPFSAIACVRRRGPSRLETLEAAPGLRRTPRPRWIAMPFEQDPFSPERDVVQMSASFSRASVAGMRMRAWIRLAGRSHNIARMYILCNTGQIVLLKSSSPWRTTHRERVLDCDSSWCLSVANAHRTYPPVSVTICVKRVLLAAAQGARAELNRARPGIRSPTRRDVRRPSLCRRFRRRHRATARRLRQKPTSARSPSRARAHLGAAFFGEADVLRAVRLLPA